jgi:hypothetical protein
MRRMATGQPPCWSLLPAITRRDALASVVSAGMVRTYGQRRERVKHLVRQGVAGCYRYGARDVGMFRDDVLVDVAVVFASDRTHPRSRPACRGHGSSPRARPLPVGVHPDLHRLPLRSGHRRPSPADLAGRHLVGVARLPRCWPGRSWFNSAIAFPTHSAIQRHVVLHLRGSRCTGCESSFPHEQDGAHRSGLRCSGRISRWRQ